MFANVIPLIGTALLWGFIHSLFASRAAKEFFRHAFGAGFMRFYRLGYNIFAALSFLPILWLMWILENRTLYVVPAPWNLLMLAGQGLAAILLLIGVLQTDTLSFIGLRQLVEADPKASALVTSGLYRFVRHPLYSAGLLFIWLTPVMTFNTLIVYVAATIYILIGAFFEERKLLHEFGPAYRDYRSATPMLIPALRLRRNKSP